MLLLFVTSCTDYDLRAKEKERAAPDPEDTGEPEVDDSAAEEDTGDTAHGEDTVDPPDDTAPVATESVYLNTADTLYSYDPITNVATRIGTFGVSEDITDIAIDLNGSMYGCSFSTLYSINPVTARAARIAAVADDLVGLTFVSDGRLVGAGGLVSFVDTGTGRLTTLVSSGQYTTSGDIIGLPDGQLYWTVQGGDQLIRIDPNSGDTTRMGNINVSSIFALGYANGDLYGFTSAGRRVVIDETNGRATDNDALGGVWWGATTNPVLW